MMTDSFLDYLRFEKNYSEKTIVSYGIDLTKFEEYFKGKDEKVDFTTVDAAKFVSWYGADYAQEIAWYQF